ncbi:hypothetical protein G6F46_000782 [Rhizopus delemar]|nr:hypothetical protein G6F55_006135 [Rhizopus delemar]KAG1553339.1 hypothetical protein G6F51_000655 [Rhizopus arrhizus]KAG1494620.1 hypothetical protein G6F54_007751 [Rhizopus delemar]KAG1518521.1 hypothetical protein G6F53_000533 [Rhizopus delemar]KAG1524553.1 hypothetical protein G6F52_004092 [Rhizopus delemar]
MDTYNFANTEQTQDNIISELLDEIADAFEDDQIPTKSTTSETDESGDPDLTKSKRTNYFKSIRKKSLSKIEHVSTENDNFGSSRSDYSVRNVRRRVDNSFSEPTPSRSHIIPTTPPQHNQHHFTTPSPHHYMYSTNTASPSTGFDGNANGETGTLERNVASLYISKDPTIKPTSNGNTMSDYHSTRNSGMSNNNNNNETPLQNRKLSLTTDEQNKPIPAISRELEKISINGNEYTILKEIGKGSTGKVYQVLSHTYGEIYALKWIEIKRIEDHQNTVNEIELLKSLNSEENIINLVDYHIMSSVIFMMLEYGEIDLATLIQKQSKKEWDLYFIKYYWKQMLYAVDAIHRKHIVHSDLKPANFVLAKGRLKLIDFGIAKKHSDDTTSIHRDIQVGTINYMSPEALSDINEGMDGSGSLIKLGSSSDIWSLGCILYQMVYGKTPFYHLTVAQKVANIPNPLYKITYPRQITFGSNNILVDIPDHLIQLLARCLQRSPRLRPTMPELLSASL